VRRSDARRESTTSVADLFSSRADFRYQDRVEVDDATARVLSPQGDTSELDAKASFSTTSSGGSFLFEERTALSLTRSEPCGA
jgi:hypothetical protein